MKIEIKLLSDEKDIKMILTDDFNANSNFLTLVIVDDEKHTGYDISLIDLYLALKLFITKKEKE